MSKLKKYAAIGGGIALIACWPFAVGQIGESAFKHGIDSFQNPKIKIDNLSYERGYLSSHAQTRVSITDKDLQALMTEKGLPTEMTLDQEIKHGIFSITSSFTVADETVPEFIKNMTLMNEIQVTGATETTFTTQDINWTQSEIKESEIASLKLASSSLIIDSDLDGNVVVEYTIPELALRFNDDSDLIVKNLSGGADGSYQSSLFFGHSNMTVDSLAINDNAKDFHNVMNNIQYTALSTVNEKENVADNTINSTHRLTIDEMKAGGDVLKEGVLDISFQDFNYDASIQLFSLMREPASNRDITEPLLNAYNLLMSKGLSFNINEFSFHLAGGQFAGEFSLKLPKGMENASANTALLIQHLQGGGEITIDKEIVDENADLKQEMEGFLTRKIAEENEDNYRFSTKIEEGNFVLPNGEKMPLFMLAVLMSSSL